ncbi:hypothetical protein EYZ11_011253 [Aspergillus tanneri]|uniref:Thioesterase domain-containing protein n=1 Tax=Aspergillus tanneri TaxID=1220188 RepID=A0A4S3J3K9_9EURO|nr:uncharacterized protein ATNIH1004_010780 [Aspergillus tanneri]KAA8641841.1 hypothetical protein ATNIH1004_010780 [Aspergillus tanneri]THC89295.1 hypothetical protein EYZ11_011253 [Aspergillus tanneri]
MAAETPLLTHVRAVQARIQNKSPIYAFLLDEAEIYEAQPGVIRASVRVNKKQINSKGTLHGSFSACVLDWAGGLAIASHGLESTGLSTDMHVSYVSTAKEGDKLEIEGRTSRVGRSLAFTTVVISKTKEDGELSVVAQGSHTKYIVR